jgi:hypothetical protein
MAVAAVVVVTVRVRGQGEVVVWWKEVVEFRLLIEFEPREFRHMTLARLLKMRRYFELSLTRNQSHGFNLRVEASISPLFLNKFRGIQETCIP